MEVCGGQTHTLVRSGIDRLVPEGLRLVHGPGCPVCVTPLEQIDRALAIAARPGVIFTSFGDMLRVPGTTQDLLRVRAEGGDVRIVYSPLDAVRIAQDVEDRSRVGGDEPLDFHAFVGWCHAPHPATAQGNSTIARVRVLLRGAQLVETEPPGGRTGFAPIRDPELREDVGHVHTRGFDRDEQRLGDLTISPALAEQRQDVEFACREPESFRG